MKKQLGLARGGALLIAFIASGQACGDDTEGKAPTNEESNGGGVGEGGAAGSGASATSSLAGIGEGGVPHAAAGGPAVAGASDEVGGLGAADGGANSSAGAPATACQISWSGDETGEAGCPRVHVCQTNFLSLNLDGPALQGSLKSIQLVYSPAHDLTLGTFVAVGHDMVNSVVQSATVGVSYAPRFDKDQMLTAGSSMTVTLTALSISSDSSDVCSDTAHGSVDAVLPRTDAPAGGATLSLHAEF